MTTYLLATILIAVFGLAAVFSWLSRGHKDTLLASELDGLQPLALGALLLVLGFALGRFDLVGAYLLKGIGMVFATFGGLVLIPDGATEKILHPIMGVIYAIVAVAAYYFGTMATLGMFVFNMHALLIVVPLVAAATFFATLSALAFTSEEFRDRLEQDDGGVWLIIFGILVMLAAPFGAMVIITSALGALLATLGVLIVIDDDQVEWLLAKSKTIVYAIFMIIALVCVRLL